MKHETLKKCQWVFSWKKIAPSRQDIVCKSHTKMGEAVLREARERWGESRWGESRNKGGLQFVSTTHDETTLSVDDIIENRAIWCKHNTSVLESACICGNPHTHEKQAVKPSSKQTPPPPRALLVQLSTTKQITKCETVRFD